MEMLNTVTSSVLAGLGAVLPVLGSLVVCKWYIAGQSSNSNSKIEAENNLFIKGWKKTISDKKLDRIEEMYLHVLNLERSKTNSMIFLNGCSEEKLTSWLFEQLSLLNKLEAYAFMHLGPSVDGFSELRDLHTDFYYNEISYIQSSSRQDKGNAVNWQEKIHPQIQRLCNELKDRLRKEKEATLSSIV